MEITERFPEALFFRDDAAGLQSALERWERPELEVLMELLDLAAEKPHTTACLLRYIHERFPADSTAAGRKRKKQLGLLDWDDEDWSACFRWETDGRDCRILAYLGRDEEVLIPEEMGGLPVTEVAQSFFLRAGTVRRLLVPEGVQIGTVLPREARGLYGQSPAAPELFRLERETPPPLPERPAADLPSGDVRRGQTLELGRWVREGSEAVSPMGWRVLWREEGRALLLAEEVLECLPYHRSRSAVLWPDCDLRRWLNDCFLPAAFLPEEQSLLLPAELSGRPNPVFRTRDASYSQDRIFLLSPDEWEEHGAQAWDGAPLWLRMPGLNTQYAVTLEKTARVDHQGRLVNDGAVGVLPAVWIQI